MIRSRDNPRARLVRRLRSPHGRRVLDLLLLEGPHLVSAGAGAGLVFRELLVTPEFRADPDHALLRIEEACRLRARPIEAARLHEMADADTPQGIAAIAEPPAAWVSAGGTLARSGGIHLYLDGIQDPGNLGAISRSAEASGAASLILGPETVRPGHPRALRSSAGSLLRLPLRRDADPRHVPEDARWLALAPRSSRHGSPTSVRLFDGSDALRDLRSEDMLVLVVGAESRGLSRPVLARVDRFLTIPMAPPVESLNAAVAASLALFELRRLLKQMTSSS